VIYRFIQVEKANHTIALLCRVLGVHRSAYYQWCDGVEARAARAAADDALAEQIRAIHGRHRGRYGSPRVHRELRRQGRPVNRKRIERIMRSRRIVGISRRRRWSLTKQDTAAAPAPDLLQQDFTAERPGTKLVGDITYLPTAEGWLYLATVIDLATREVIGYAMAEHMRADLVVDAIDAAAKRHRLASGCIMHTDRGSQYTSTDFRAALTRHDLRQSMGRTGICYDNAAAEAFFASLKAEIGTQAWATRADARADVFLYIEAYYNRQRLHSTNGYRTPHEMRLMLQSSLSPAHNG
jgi:putative transposase